MKGKAEDDTQPLVTHINRQEEMCPPPLIYLTKRLSPGGVVGVIDYRLNPCGGGDTKETIGIQTSHCSRNVPRTYFSSEDHSFCHQTVILRIQIGSNFVLFSRLHTGITIINFALVTGNVLKGDNSIKWF